MILNKKNSNYSKEYLKKIVDICVDFKLQDNVNKNSLDSLKLEKILKKIPINGKNLEDTLKEFEKNLLPYCTNFSSNNFMGFPDSGNSVAAMGGAIFSELLQQNLINHSFCGPSATFAEITVIQWLREVVGYKINKIKNIQDVGGVITPGGTSSNTIALMVARENHIKGTIKKGVRNPKKYKIIIPKGISHYSIKSSQMWLGCGNNTIEIPTINYKMDLDELKKALIKNKGEIMAVVCYAGDSRTMTIDNLNGIYRTVKAIDKNIWLHVDACHGFSLGFSNKLKNKISGIEKFDSVTTDPHKVLATPYVISAVLFKNPKKLTSVASFSDLIMQETFAFGQITPLLGSRNWASLKLWFFIKNFGKRNIGKMIEKRHNLALCLSKKLKNTNDFIVINDVGINSVMFMYGNKKQTVEKLNDINIKIYKKILKDGKYYIHQFPIKDDKGVVAKNQTVYPLRYMSGNPNMKEKDLDGLIKYIREVSKNI